MKQSKARFIIKLIVLHFKNKNMKKIVICIVVVIVASCNVPKDGEQENIPTSKLEVLTNLGDEDTAKVAKDSTAHSEAH